jgi:hypothetical protein
MSMRPRLIRPVEPALGLYFRPGRNDHQKLLDLLAEGQLSISGLVLDACLVGRHEELRREAISHGLEAILDPRSCELATEGGFRRSGVCDLPWAFERPHVASDLIGEPGDALASGIARFAIEHDYNAVLAPTHLLAAGSRDGWLDVDVALARSLRRALDAGGAEAVPVYYPLVLPSAVLRDAGQRETLMSALRRVPADAVWLRVTPFGTNSGPLAIKRYIEACHDLQRLELPLIAEHVGAAGLPLLAFGAVGGIESGITLGEQFDVRPLVRPPSNSEPFAPAPRVYLPELGAFLTRARAAAFFDNRQMKVFFGCKNGRCCRRGWADMIADPRRHFLLRRAGEVARLSRAPSTVRPQLYLDEFLRPATDLGIRAAQVDESLVRVQRKLEGWRVTLGALVSEGVVPPAVRVPEGRRAVRQLGGLGEGGPVG